MQTFVIIAKKCCEKGTPSLAGLTNKISDASRSVRIFGIKFDSKRRLEVFYAIGFLMVAIVFISLLFAKPSRPTVNPTPSSQSKPAELTAPIRGEIDPSRTLE